MINIIETHKGNAPLIGYFRGKDKRLDDTLYRYDRINTRFRRVINFKKLPSPLPMGTCFWITTDIILN